MSIIKPISDLRNHADQISKICHEERKPVFITKNGKGDLVVMSQVLYEQQQTLIKLLQQIEEAEQDAKSNPKGISHKEMMTLLRHRIA